ncbi:hypothetical protein [Gordonia malaquae]|uniref:hypothetical protein n=1 Tax=Gordonia malaquae TaxID=410332 RepID=UPI003019AB0D
MRSITRNALAVAATGGLLVAGVAGEASAWKAVGGHVGLSATAVDGKVTAKVMSNRGSQIRCSIRIYDEAEYSPLKGAADKVADGQTKQRSQDSSGGALVQAGLDVVTNHHALAGELVTMPAGGSGESTMTVAPSGSTFAVIALCDVMQDGAEADLVVVKTPGSVQRTGSDVNSSPWGSLGGIFGS